MPLRLRPPRRPKPFAKPALLLFGGLTGLATLGAAALSGGNAATPSNAAYTDTATNCRVVDGDTLHCDGGRIRLLGIDAPELPGHCATGRDCAPGDPYASSRTLSDGMGNGRSLRIETVGTDRYGRTLALVWGSRGDLSCWQLTHRAAIYKPRWDNGGLVAATCPEDAR